jgi:tetratricopeptide (TPR) repeat protein
MKQLQTPLQMLSIILATLMALTPFSGSVIASTTKARPLKNAQNETIQNTQTNTEIPPQSQHAQLLTYLLTAEIALTRKQPKVALEAYMNAIRISPDPLIAQQATLLSIQLEQPKEAIESATLWAQKAPDNLQAQLVASTLLIGVSKDQALTFLTRAIEISPEDTDRQLAGIQGRLSDASRKQLGIALQSIAKSKPKNAYAHLIAAHSAAQEENISLANYWVDSALTLSPKLTKAIELKARLIRFSDNADTNALNYLAQKITENPTDGELILFYSNALIDSNRFEEAVQQLNTITTNTEFGGQALLLLGEYHLKSNQIEKAKKELLQATSSKDVKEVAHYLLGQLYEQQKDIPKAIEHYSAVTEGTDHIQAVIKAATLLTAQKNYDEALELIHNSNPNSLEEEKQLILTELDILSASNQLEQAMSLADTVLAKIPNDIDMRFKHSFLAEKSGQKDVAEEDLKVIIKLNPNHTAALSALGFLLSNQEHREKEAAEYLTRAIQLEPNNAENLDRLGWLYYKMGDTKQALSNLKKAYDQNPDAKIAARMAEVMKKQAN